MDQKINVLIVEPGKEPRPATVEDTLEAFQQIVGGPIFGSTELEGQGEAPMPEPTAIPEDPTDTGGDGTDWLAPLVCAGGGAVLAAAVFFGIKKMKGRGSEK